MHWKRWRVNGDPLVVQVPGPAKTCAVEGCLDKARARGWCIKHYSRWARVGDPLGFIPPALEERFWSKVDVRGPDECWPWIGARSADGYGAFGLNGKDCCAHRVAWELVHGPIPDGKLVCHHCDNPPCCNPYRCLFLGTPADNMADMVAKGRARGRYSTPKVVGDA